MILVLSHEHFEPTTEAVLDWVEHLGGDALRLNGEDLNGDGPFSLVLDGADGELRFTVGTREFRAADVGAVWLRRWHGYAQFDVDGRLGDARLERSVGGHLMREVGAVTDALNELLEGARWLTHPAELRLNKMRALRAAAAAGLDTPATLITNDRAALQEFKDRHGRIITKAVGDVDMFCVDNRMYGMYTVEVDQAEIDRTPALFFPSLVQELLQKEYELRVYWLNGESHAMAIFSQDDERTEVDFRRYNHTRPSRSVPYRLDAATERRITATMAALGATNGSVDLVRTRCGRLVFLEVNPAGQFGMVSQPCNYRLEKKVAEHLMRSDEHARH